MLVDFVVATFLLWLARDGVVALDWDAHARLVLDLHFIYLNLNFC